MFLVWPLLPLSLVVPFFRIPFSVDASCFLRPFLEFASKGVLMKSLLRLLLMCIKLPGDFISAFRRSSWNEKSFQSRTSSENFKTHHRVASPPEIRAQQSFLQLILQSCGHVLLHSLVPSVTIRLAVNEVKLPWLLLVVVRVDDNGHGPLNFFHGWWAWILRWKVHWRRNRNLSWRVVHHEAFDGLHFGKIAASFDCFLHRHSSHCSLWSLAIASI